jgi:ribosomal protein S30
MYYPESLSDGSKATNRLNFERRVQKVRTDRE